MLLELHCARQCARLRATVALATTAMRHGGGELRRRCIPVIKGATATAIKRRGEEGEMVAELTAVP